MNTKSTPKPEEDDDFDFIEEDDEPIETDDLVADEDEKPEETKDSYRPDYRKRIEDLLEERRFQKENRDFLDELDEIDEE